ncbi:MAG: Unknown protein [uncultured Aureispira sp.]|uniref:TIGR00725 family protein n=1 Tax=uncultured Aureispira sp. TaxID=1331704 RepID=A0A6S6U501_9BACT|nr:MAG: Unknown protein [uncultured Aureispira sp.]
MIKQVSVIGPNKSACTDEIYSLGIQLGQALAQRDLTIITGGMEGFMEAVFKGAHRYENYRKGSTIGILPFLEKERANPYCDVIIPSGIGFARNQLVVSAGDLLIAVGGGAGTLSEIAFAWQFNKRVICYKGLGGWSEKLAGLDLDNRKSNLLLEANSIPAILNILDNER